MPTAAVLTGLGPSTKVPGATGAVVTDPYVDNIFIETELSFLFIKASLKHFPQLSVYKKEAERNIDLMSAVSWAP